eukprot:CAMPEP_0119570816 /NCGR_PEP_ID=MMETSP1352-20130426/43803_1 /TAXON_ID=265584 /ORGANISM="Stauroneis constricta, Strain CCMP1120" /LENGTH=661 /DNA_ID=CAMNT_0007620491 /DNA_START=35 /DNA_END=2020 /DNA_ORIENTATION=-
MKLFFGILAFAAMVTGAAAQATGREPEHGVDAECPNDMATSDAQQQSSSSSSSSSSNNTGDGQTILSIWDILDEGIATDDDLLHNVKDSLADGVLIQIQNAFDKGFAADVADLLVESFAKEDKAWKHVRDYNANGTNSMYHELSSSSSTSTDPNEDHNDDHSKKDDFRYIHDVFQHDESRELYAALSGYDCLGKITSTMKWYDRNDYTNPNNNPAHSVTMIWDLTKEWKYDLGGMLHWGDAYDLHAYNKPEFNTLHLFTAQSPSMHTITPVSNELYEAEKTSKMKRLLWVVTVESHSSEPIEEDEEDMATTTKKNNIGRDVVQSMEQRFETERNVPAKRPRTPITVLELEPSYHYSSTNVDDKSKTSSTFADFNFTSDSSIFDCINPKFLEDPQNLQKAKETLQSDGLLVIRNVFFDDLAHLAHDIILQDDCEWNQRWYSSRTGFSTNKSDTPICSGGDMPEYEAIQAMFSHESSKDFMEYLIERDTTGEVITRSGIYGIGDHTSSHTDAQNSRAVAYLWNLSQNWKPEWGGSFVWGSGQMEHAYQFPTFNTFLLFSVGPRSGHTVTPSTEESEGYTRIAYGGWYNADPKNETSLAIDDPISEIFSTRQSRRQLTTNTVLHIDKLMKLSKDEEKRQKLLEFVRILKNEQLNPSKEETISVL